MQGIDELIVKSTLWNELDSQLQERIKKFIFERPVPSDLYNSVNSHLTTLTKNGYDLEELKVFKRYTITNIARNFVNYAYQYFIETPFVGIITASHSENVIMYFTSNLETKKKNQEGSEIQELLTIAIDKHNNKLKEEEEKENQIKRKNAEEAKAKSLELKKKREDESQSELALINEWIEKYGSEQLKLAVSLNLEYKNTFWHEWTVHNFPESIHYWNADILILTPKKLPSVSQMKKFQELKENMKDSYFPISTTLEFINYRHHLENIDEDDEKMTEEEYYESEEYAEFVIKCDVNTWNGGTTFYIEL